MDKMIPQDQRREFKKQERPVRGENLGEQ